MIEGVLPRSLMCKFYAAKVTRPFLMIHSLKAPSPHWADRFYSNVKTEKSRHFVESRGQTDFYDNIDDRKRVCTAHK